MSRKKRTSEYAAVPASVQQTIPINKIYADGIFELPGGLFSMTYSFTDINYAVASKENKQAMFFQWSDVLNMLDSNSTANLEVRQGETVTEDGTEVTETRILHIRIRGLTQAEIAMQYGFSERQMAQLAELTDSQFDDAWRNLLYGSSGGSGDIVDVALSQVGNVGGQPYWSWYGFGGKVDWCACFVSWCANESGYIDAGIIPKFSGCTSQGMAWFQARGQWADRSYTPNPGDLIFFDWDSSGDADHVGIVERVEDGTVYTVEGNSGTPDAVRQQSYPIGWRQIRGYGFPAY